jgi:hypothetical protein
MKIEVRGNEVIVTSETRKEAYRLIDLVLVRGEDVKPHKPHKKHNHRKECDICGKSFKGLQGLGIHKAKHNRDLIIQDNTHGKS